MVALSMADGWARTTGQPQAVIVHVDVGTQALGAAMHNANTGRVPVLIFAGLCPYTESGDLPGRRTEYQHWLQDIPDQRAIVRQYCRYVGEIRSGQTVKETVARAIQMATSDPKGPVYLVGAREVMAEKMPRPSMPTVQKHFGPIGPAALPDSAVTTIADALSRAESPLVVTGYSGRNPTCPAQLVRLADLIPNLHVLDTGGSGMCFPFSHPAALGFRLGVHPAIGAADTILILDCDVPWIPSRNRPHADARVYHVDVDPLNERINRSFFPAHGRWRADAETALTQLNTHLTRSPLASTSTSHDLPPDNRRQERAAQHTARLAGLAELARPPLPSSHTLSAHHVGAVLRATLPTDVVYVVEAATNVPALADQLQVSRPGSWINSAGAGLGWSGGAALGVKLALNARGEEKKFVCQMAGDGVFMFSVPSSVYWIASRYGIPVLTVVLNNKGTWTVSSLFLHQLLRLLSLLSNPVFSTASILSVRTQLTPTHP